MFDIVDMWMWLLYSATSNPSHLSEISVENNLIASEKQGQFIFFLERMHYASQMVKCLLEGWKKKQHKSTAHKQEIGSISSSEHQMKR